MSAAAPATPRRTLGLVLVCTSPFLGLAVWHFWVPYSLWYDELCTVASCGGTWHQLATALAHDVHPPLYEVGMKLWMAVFGAGEVQLRTPSLLCALAAFAVLCAGLRHRRPALAVATTLYFATCWLFGYYAQEVRSYATLLLAATVATVMDRRRAADAARTGDWAWYAALLALALVHYFGLLYALLLLLGDVWRHGRGRRRAAIGRTAAVAALMLVWPCLQFARGGLADKLGGHFWIQVNGIGGTVWAFVQGVIDAPRFTPRALAGLSQWNLPLMSSVVLVAATGWALWLAKGPDRRDLRGLATMIVGFVGIVALIDKVAPVSTDRNYIVLLPPMALLFGHVVDVLWTSSGHRWQRALVALMVVAFSAKAGVRALGAMEERWGPRQNWKALAASLESAGACRPACWVTSPGNTAAYYFKGSVPPPAFDPITLDDLLARPLADVRPMVAGQISSPDLVQLRNRHADWACLEPPQSWPDSVVFLTPSAAIPPGLRPCRPPAANVGR